MQSMTPSVASSIRAASRHTRRLPSALYQTLSRHLRTASLLTPSLRLHHQSECCSPSLRNHKLSANHHLHHVARHIHTSRHVSSSSSSGSKKDLGRGPSGGQLIEFNLADIGEGISECEVLKWFVSVGDHIQQFDKLCEVQSDKANVEITSRYDGYVRQLHYQEGQLAKVGQPLCLIEVDASDDADADAETHDADTDIDKTTEQAPAPSQTAAETSPSAATSTNGYNHVSSNGKRILTSPAVRSIAREHNIDLSLIVGGGPAGRILKDDVMRYIENPDAVKQQKPARASVQQPPDEAAETLPHIPSPPAAASIPTQPAVGYLEHDVNVPVSGIQRIMVQTMNAANAIPTFGFSDEVVVDQLVLLREQLKSTAEQRDVKLSYLPFIIKATSLALRSFPQLNAHVNSDCTAVTQKAAHNIGLAMDTPRGLLVPNIKHVERLSIYEIGRELNRLAALGTVGKLGKDDLTGGTFTLSNIGSLGGTYMRPILVVPEVMIGALGSFRTLPRYDAAMNVKPTRVMNISWTGDHRVLDGATTARFHELWKSYIEQPSRILLDTR